MDSSRFPFEKLEHEKKRLASLRKYEPLVSDTDEDLDRLVKAAAFICDTPISLVNLIEANQTIFKAAVGTTMKGSPREISFCSKAIQGNGLMEVPDASLDLRFKDNPLVTGPEKIRFYAGSPLVNKEGLSMGTLCVFDQKPKALLPAQKEALETLGKMAVMVMESKKQQAMQQKVNLPFILALESQLKEQEKKLQLLRKFLPPQTAAQYFEAGERSVDAEIKALVILRCRINGYAAMTKIMPAEKVFAILQAYYTLVTDVFSTYNGLVYQYDGETITGIFSEPLATFPYEENALYCAFDAIRQVAQPGVLQTLSSTQPLTISVSLHSGQVVGGTVNLPASIEYVITGNVIKQSASILENFSITANTVFATSAFYENIRHLANIKKIHPLAQKEETDLPDVFEIGDKATN